MLERLKVFTASRNGKIAVGVLAFLVLGLILYVLFAPSEAGGIGIGGPPGGGGIFDPSCKSNTDCKDPAAKYCANGKCVQCNRTPNCENGKECKDNKCVQIEDKETSKRFTCPLPANSERQLCSDSDYCMYNNTTKKCVDRVIGNFIECIKIKRDGRCRERNDRCLWSNGKCTIRTIPE